MKLILTLYLAFNQLVVIIMLWPLGMFSFLYDVVKKGFVVDVSWCIKDFHTEVAGMVVGYGGSCILYLFLVENGLRVPAWYAQGALLMGVCIWIRTVLSMLVTVAKKKGEKK